jgi:5-methylcytosine-specific restriction endonuclease McrA
MLPRCCSRRLLPSRSSACCETPILKRHRTALRAGCLPDSQTIPAPEPARPYHRGMIASRSRRARAAKRRKRRMDRVEHDLSDEQWIALKEAWGGCAYCAAVGKPLQRDCVQALSRGGRYTLDNIVPACGSCNTSKCNDEVTGWLRRKRLNERLFLLRYAQIKTTLGAHFASKTSGPADALPRE